MGLTHFDEAPALESDLGHLRARWTMLGEAAGSERIGLRRIEIRAGGFSTPVHEHRDEEEIFFVLGGRGLSWQDGRTAEIATGDCIVYLGGQGAHTLHALEPLDVLAFGTRERDASAALPRLGLSLVGPRAVASVPYLEDGARIQFVRESKLGPPELPDPSPRPPTVVALDDVAAATERRPRIERTRRNLGVAAGSITSGLQHVTVAPGKLSAPQHCHSLEEELFVILDGDGVLLLGEEEIPVGSGHVVGRPAGTGVAHAFRGGADGLSYLAYGMREPGDICFYPRSGKIAFGGVDLVARIEPLDYWDGED